MLRRPGNIRGQTTVEFALAATIFFLITFGLIQFAILYHYKLVLGHASREGARYAACQAGSDPGMGTETQDRIKVETIKRAGTLNPPLQPANITIATGPAQGDTSVTLTITYDVRPLVPLIAPLLPSEVTFTGEAAMRTEQ